MLAQGRNLMGDVMTNDQPKPQPKPQLVQPMKSCKTCGLPTNPLKPHLSPQTCINAMHMVNIRLARSLEQANQKNSFTNRVLWFLINKEPQSEMTLLDAAYGNIPKNWMLQVERMETGFKIAASLSKSKPNTDKKP